MRPCFLFDGGKTGMSNNLLIFLFKMLGKAEQILGERRGKAEPVK